MNCKKKRLFGTAEWSDDTHNLYIGCSNDCVYCYAKANAIFHKFSTLENWPKMMLKKHIKQWKQKKQMSPKKGRTVMFPSSHDITPETVDRIIISQKQILEAGNNLLIVSKPRIQCIEKICKELSAYKSKVLFRFSIGSIDDKTLSLWEPHAPDFHERFTSLAFAKEQGFETSVSLEPMLDTIDNIIKLVEVLEPFVTEKIWIGKPNMLKARCTFNGHKENAAIQSEIIKLKTAHSDAEILRLVKILGGNHKIMWKDSIQKVIEKHSFVAESKNG